MEVGNVRDLCRLFGPWCLLGHISRLRAPAFIIASVLDPGGENIASAPLDRLKTDAAPTPPSHHVFGIVGDVTPIPFQRWDAYIFIGNLRRITRALSTQRAPVFSVVNMTARRMFYVSRVQCRRKPSSEFCAVPDGTGVRALRAKSISRGACEKVHVAMPEGILPHIQAVFFRLISFVMWCYVRKSISLNRFAGTERSDSGTFLITLANRTQLTLHVACQLSPVHHSPCSLHRNGRTCRGKRTRQTDPLIGRAQIGATCVACRRYTTPTAAAVGHSLSPDTICIKITKHSQH
ncbi:unnamed protein product, partial [Iphiclides podalirius]